MDIYDVMRSTFAARDFTSDLLPDEILYKILDNARFAANGGNRQGWKVIIIRNRETIEGLKECAVPGSGRYAAQRKAGENPFNTIIPTKVDEETLASTPPSLNLMKSYEKAPVILVVCVDLSVVASMDQYLDRVGVVSGGSIYPFVWNILLCARNEGFGGNITTTAIFMEPKIKELLKIPDQYAVCAIVPLGKPVKQLTKLSRKPVSSFTMHENWEGSPLERE
ncbi:MAG: nitroreductase [Candidatus Dadabacteria bacterium]|nr:nitroreductase [Candidatus Dadabacteria bacterium]NIQ15655.1 nitroreductase [Candidatus Dadabacteria bacterium]